MATASRDDDDIFADSRMSFGDHIEELRTRIFAAIKGLIFCLLIGFVLDYVGDSVGLPWLGVGKPMMKIIVDPVETQARDYYAMRAANLFQRLPDKASDPSEVERIRAKLTSYKNDYSSLSTEERRTLLAAPRELPVSIPIEPFKAVFGEPKDPSVTHISLTMRVYPAHFAAYQLEGETLLESKRYLKTLSAQEALMVYFKVSLLCGVVLGSPWIFYQFWAFIAAGMYSHEKSYVYKYLPFSIGLFFIGVLLCQFVVLPGAVKALFGFNNWIDTDPDLRLNEWLGFALILPLVFGVSFQTPLVMFFLTRLGMFGWEDYLARWRGAVMVLAVFSAVITPTPDAVTMLYLFVPMYSLYMFGILLCKLFPPSHEEFEDDDSEIAV